VLRPAWGSREAILSSDKGASSDITIHSGREGVKGSKKRRKQRLQGAMTTIGHDDDNDNGGEAPRGSLPKPCIPHPAQAQGLQYDEELLDLGVPHLGCGARRRSTWERYDDLPRGKRHHGGLRRALPIEEVPRV
jgi:hypothetical protein